LNKSIKKKAKAAISISANLKDAVEIQNPTLSTL
jgi:hypothetical protein